MPVTTILIVWVRSANPPIVTVDTHGPGGRVQVDRALQRTVDVDPGPSLVRAGDGAPGDPGAIEREPHGSVGPVRGDEGASRRGGRLDPAPCARGAPLHGGALLLDEPRCSNVCEVVGATLPTRSLIINMALSGFTTTM